MTSRKKAWSAAYRWAVLAPLRDIAAAVVYLASPGASYVTGTTVHVNGGMYMD